MGKKITSSKFSAGSSYHLVLCMGAESNHLQSSDLFVDDLEGALKFLTKKIKEINPKVPKSSIQFALDEGYYVSTCGTVLLIEPEDVHVGGME